MTFAPALPAAATSAATSRSAEIIPGAASLLLFCLTLLSPAILNDGDTFWHIAAGDWIAVHHAVPAADPFSYTFAGAPWTAHEWLSEVLLAGAYRLGEWSGVVILTATALAAAAYILLRRLALDLDGVALIAVATLGLGLLSGSMLARPHVLALPPLAAWAVGLFAAREAARAPSLALLPLMTLWANLHGSFTFGLALLGPFALEAILAAPADKKTAVARQWAFFGLLALGAALLNPRGIEALLFPVKLMGLKSLSTVAEWRPESFERIGPLEIDLLALIGFACLRPMRVAPLRLILLVGLIHLALHHTRHAMILGLIAPMILARPIAAAIGQPAPRRFRFGVSQSLALIAIFVILAGLRLAVPVARDSGPMAPISALATVPAELRAKAVLNHYGFGGYLIFSGVKPYVDGRTDLFGDAFLDNYDRIVAANPQALDEALTKNAVDWTIFPPSEPIARALDTRPGWVRLYKDNYAVVHARREALPPDLRK